MNFYLTKIFTLKTTYSTVSLLNKRLFSIINNYHHNNNKKVSLFVLVPI
jgi:hypothetical protein